MAKKGKRAPKRDWLAEFPVNDYVSALAHLAQRAERVRTDAPIGNSLRLVRDQVAVDSVSVVYHQTPVVSYFPDGSQVLHWGGWFTKTTFEHMERFARLRRVRLRCHGHSRNGYGDGVEIWRDVPSWPREPSKLTRCRACRGTGRRGEPSEWHDGSCWNCGGRGVKDRGSAVIPRLVQGKDAVLLLPRGGFKVLPDYGAEATTYPCKCSLCQCGCGNWQEHWMTCVTPKKFTTSLWSSMDPEPEPEDPEPEPEVTPKPMQEMPQPSEDPYAMGSEVAAELSALLPGMHELVDCPKCRERNQIQVRDQIVHLNDVHRATREEIADWLEALDVDLRFPTPA